MTLNIPLSFTVITYINYITFLVIILEALYSYFKKDSIHNIGGTISNTANGLFMKLVLNLVSIAYFNYLVLLYKMAGFNIAKPNLSPLSVLLCLLTIDFSWYIYHRSHHYFRLLWSFHWVHHSDTNFNSSTAYRFSWVEKMYNITIFIPALLVGFNPYVIMVCFAASSIYEFFHHMPYLRFPKILSYIFITPQGHKVHHDQALKHQNANFGAVFSFWDKLFGTYVEEIDNFKPGIKGYHQNNFIKVQTDPIIAYFKRNK